MTRARARWGWTIAPYRRLVDYDGQYSDVYLVDTVTGQRSLILSKLRGGSGVQWSPDGKFALFYQNKQWHLFDAAARAAREVSSKLGVAVHDEDDDTPDPPGSYGYGGWARDSQSFLIYDRFDVWQVFVGGQPAKNVTEGEGRRTRTVFRVERLEPSDEDNDESGIDIARPLFLRGVREDTRASGIFHDSFAGSAAPQRLLWGDRNYRVVTRARDADVLVLSASRFDEYPDLHVTDSSFRTLSKATSGGLQLQPFTWGTGELVSFRNTDGVPLKAALYKPQNFDPKKKYPMLVYIYEGLSQNLHSFVEPRPGHSINFAYYVSNGYLVLTPDIVYTEGAAGADRAQVRDARG